MVSTLHGRSVTRLPRLPERVLSRGLGVCQSRCHCSPMQASATVRSDTGGIPFGSALHTSSTPRAGNSKRSGRNSIVSGWGRNSMISCSHHFAGDGSQRIPVAEVAAGGEGVGPVRQPSQEIGIPSALAGRSPAQALSKAAETSSGTRTGAMRAGALSRATVVQVTTPSSSVAPTMTRPSDFGTR